MRRKKYSWIIIPCIFAILLLSLPIERNQKIRNAIGEKLSLLMLKKSKSQEEFTSSSNEVIDSETLALLEWQDEQDDLRQSKGEEAEVLISHNLNTTLSQARFRLAKVIFRSNTTWNNSLWIDVGSEDNPKDGPIIIGRNSPVLSGDSVIGVIDYVGKKASLVRLITDSGICPAVRVKRNRSSTRISKTHIQILYKEVEKSSNHFKTPEEKKAFLFLLKELLQTLPQNEEIDYLAKGELHGQGEPLWRSSGKILKGVGFNYDFSDKEGPARDLRTGEVIDPENEYTERPKMSIIQVGDLLVTSGLDGIFPEGLKIAEVTTISPLKEGDYSYSICAKPTAEDILLLQYVSVLPPQKYSEEEIPNRAEMILELLDQES